jgi:uncharacterized protein
MSRWMHSLMLVAACGGGARTGSRTIASNDDPRRVPDGYVRMLASDVISSQQGDAVLLVDSARSVILPILIGGTEAASIALRLSSQPAPRPLTHDLLDSVIRQLGAQLVKVHIDRVVGGIFIGSIFIRTEQGTRRIDARPSDAIALAIGNRVPIYVARPVLNESGLKPAQLEGAETAAADAAPQSRISRSASLAARLLVSLTSLASSRASSLESRSF